MLWRCTPLRPPALLLAACLLSTLLTPPTHAQTAGLSCQPCPGTPLPAGMCTVEERHLDGTGCGGFDNCQEPQAVPDGIEVIDQGDGTFEARLPVDVTAPYNSHRSNRTGETWTRDCHRGRWRARCFCAAPVPWRRRAASRSCSTRVAGVGSDSRGALIAASS